MIVPIFPLCYNSIVGFYTIGGENDMKGVEIYLELLAIATTANEIQSVIQLIPPGQFEIVRTILANELKTQTDLFNDYSEIVYLSDFEIAVAKPNLSIVKKRKKRGNVE